MWDTELVLAYLSSRCFTKRLTRRLEACLLTDSCQWICRIRNALNTALLDVRCIEIRIFRLQLCCCLEVAIQCLSTLCCWRTFDLPQKIDMIRPARMLNSTACIQRASARWAVKMRHRLQALLKITRICFRSLTSPCQDSMLSNFFRLAFWLQIAIAFNCTSLERRQYPLSALKTELRQERVRESLCLRSLCPAERARRCSEPDTGLFGE